MQVKKGRSELVGAVLEFVAPVGAGNYAWNVDMTYEAYFGFDLVPLGMGRRSSHPPVP